MLERADGERELRTGRLRLRRWRPEDRAPFAALNADPAVARWLAGPLTRAESDALVDRIEAGFEVHGFGLFAVEPLDAADERCVGYVGLAAPTFEAAFTPCVEVGWRLAPAVWGRGFATEAARAVLDEGFAHHGLDEVVSFTAEGNDRSRAVMARLGMHHDPADDFDHPALAVGHPLRRHVRYRIRAEEWPDDQPDDRPEPPAASPR